MYITKTHKKNLAIGLIGVAILIASFFFDSAITENIEKFRNPVFDYVLEWASYGLTIIFIMLVMTSLFMWEENRKGWIMPLWMSFIATVAVTMVIKLIVLRERPEGFVSFFFDEYSFPSGHTATCFSVVPLLDEVYPILKWFWIMFAVLVGISRIYLKAHYPSDVIAGALIGFAIGTIMLYMKTKHSGAVS